MNTIYQVLAKHIDKESKYTGTSLLAFMKLVIKVSNNNWYDLYRGRKPGYITESCPSSNNELIGLIVTPLNNRQFFCMTVFMAILKFKCKQTRKSHVGLRREYEYF